MLTRLSRTDLHPSHEAPCTQHSEAKANHATYQVQYPGQTHRQQSHTDSRPFDLRGRAHISCVRSRSVLYPEVRKHSSQLPETFQSVAAVALAAASAVVDQTIKRSPKPEGPVHLLVQFGLRTVSSTLPKPCTHSGPLPLSPRYHAL